MNIIVRKESWKRFALKAAIVLVLLWIAGTSFAGRYRIAYDPQLERCLPNHSVYLIDLKDKELHRDAIYAFSAKGMEPLYDDGTKMLKILSGMPGDTVEVNKNWEVVVNGEVKQLGLQLANKLNVPASHFFGKGVLPEKHYWFLGESISSFDSRYWGAVKDEQIIGRAYPLF